MKQLFTIQASNTHQPLLLCDSSQWPAIGAQVNRVRMVGTGLMPVFGFEQIDEKTVDLPDICTVYISGAIAFRADLKEALFPDASTQLEFLPIMASGKSWLLLNCLQTATNIDPEGSEVMRGLNGDICFVMKIRVTDPKAQDWDVFTLTDSNRAQLFVTDVFRARVAQLKLKGITFKQIGEIA
jgi:hypothetical protein